MRLEARRPPGHPDHIEPYKIIALDKLGFDWDPRENYWQKKFEELKEYIERHPESKMPTRKTPLGVWCDGQVLEYNKFHEGKKPCYISKERIEQLNSIGFIWNRMGTAWSQSFENLKKYRLDNGHCHVPVNHTDKTLFRWIAKQRKKYKNYKTGKKPALTEDQIKLLDSIDFFESSEQRLAKYNAQKEKEKRDGKMKSITSSNGGSSGKGTKRGRPKAKTLIPQEAQIMAPPPQSAIYTPVHYPMGSISLPPTPAATAITAMKITTAANNIDVALEPPAGTVNDSSGLPVLSESSAAPILDGCLESNTNMHDIQKNEKNQLAEGGFMKVNPVNDGDEEQVVDVDTSMQQV